MAAIAARHYDTACRPCHAAPGERRTATMRAMVPVPPPIRDAVSEWEPRHLFWIALNGIKMSGMPHWPAQDRRDEAWTMAAFLDRVRFMGREEYQALVAPPEAEDPLVAYCAVCHGVDGAGRGNRRMPRLDILDAPYIAASLRAYRDGLRQSGIMQEAVARLSNDQIARLARHFGRQAPARPAPPPPDAQIALGRELAFGGPDSDETPACRACHGPWPENRAPLFPTLVGQHAPYIRSQLELWIEGHRGGTERANVMHQVAKLLDEDAIGAIAEFYAAGAPEHDGGVPILRPSN